MSVRLLNDWNVLNVWNDWLVDKKHVQYKIEVCIFL